MECTSAAASGRVLAFALRTKPIGAYFRRKMSSGDTKEFVRIGQVRAPILPSEHPELVPAGFVNADQTPSLVASLKWMLQKQSLGQDIFLIGTPGFLRSSVVLKFLELCNREFEYLAITRDTTEADIKQRREIRDGSAFYTDLCAVKAALRGRVLVIDGVEKAERNVLPVLNNLLENREMQLDDGRFLMAAEKFDKLLQKYPLEQLHEWKLERVSEHFLVLALGVPVPPFSGHSLDPPLRSRFQCHHLGQLPHAQMLALCEWMAPLVASTRMRRLVGVAYALNLQEPKAEEEGSTSSTAAATALPQFPTDNLLRAAQIWNACPELSEELVLQMCYPAEALRADTQRPLLEQFKQKFGLEPAPRMDLHISGVEQQRQSASPDGADGRARVQIASPDEEKPIAEVQVPIGKLPFEVGGTAANSTGFVRSSALDRLLAEMTLVHSAADFCLLGSRGSGKSALVHEFAARFGYEAETVVLYQDMSSRELLQRRRMLPNGDTDWEDGQLVRAAKRGALCVLDGIDRIHSSTAEAIAPLVHHRFLALPDGTRLIGATSFALLSRRTGLSERQLNERKLFRIPSTFRIVALGDAGTAPKWLNAQLLAQFLHLALPEPSVQERLRIIQQRVPGVSLAHAKKLCKLVERLSQSHDASIRAIGASLSLRRLVHILRRHSLHPGEGVHAAVHRASLSRFFPPVVRRAFEQALHGAHIVPDAEERTVTRPADEIAKWESAKLGKQHQKQDSEPKSSSALEETMIPSTLFFDNAQHLQAMVDMARDFELGSHLLLIGNQGVGKNKVTDRLLQLLGRARKYMQLNRDTTVQSLTVQSTVVDGVLRYEDSPLVQALREGLVLVVDEADKAPLHVVAILKSLLDGEPFYLSDGRRICPNSWRGTSAANGDDLYVHPEFRAILLANRPGFPFLGNDLFSLLGDLLAVHALDNPSKESELTMLAKYGPDVPRETLEQLVAVFGVLRQMVDQQLLAYPYSTRELVNIVKHLQKYPAESLQQAVKNVFDFDVHSPDTVQLIREAFQQKGVQIDIGPSIGPSDAYGSWSRILGMNGADSAETDRIQIERDGNVFDLSKLDEPKFGKIDPENTPHVGGNTWAGGTGGYNTAGLGGVGGPFRLDAGHPVHQLPDSAKQQVPEHILKKAREVAKAEYAKRLKEIEMSAHDAEAYNQLAAKVGKQVRVLRSVIDSLEQREHERQWAKHQTSGDLDDAKLIEGMTGERNIYRKRVDQPPDPSKLSKPKRIRLCFDVSGSMYRFNGYDRRLQRTLEAALLVMEALDGKSDKIKYDIVGHSGDSPRVPFVAVDAPPANEKERMQVLKRMLLHSQFCSSGDHTVEGLVLALRELSAESDTYDERFVILVSDANLDRYGIRPAELRRPMQAMDEQVNAFIVLIGSLGEQAALLQRALPAGKAFVAMDAAQIPEIMQQIFASTIIR